MLININYINVSISSYIISNTLLLLIILIIKYTLC